MKRFLLLILSSLMLLSVEVFSQSVGVYVGYGSSDFDEEDGMEQSGYIPAGAYILFGSGNGFEIGGEINYAVAPFTFEVNDDLTETKVADMEIGQLYYGILAKFTIGTGGGIHPYVRGGAGMYTGKLTFDYTDEYNNWGIEDSEEDFKSAFGFNLGAGASIDLSHNNGLFAEFVYHKVDRELDIEEAESFKANNWAFHVGFHFGL